MQPTSLLSDVLAVRGDAYEKCRTVTGFALHPYRAAVGVLVALALFVARGG